MQSLLSVPNIMFSHVVLLCPSKEVDGMSIILFYRWEKYTEKGQVTYRSAITIRGQGCDRIQPRAALGSSLTHGAKTHGWKVEIIAEVLCCLICFFTIHLLCQVKICLSR